MATAEQDKQNNLSTEEKPGTPNPPADNAAALPTGGAGSKMQMPAGGRKPTLPPGKNRGQGMGAAATAAQPSPPPVQIPVSKKLDVKSSVAETEEDYYSCVLPDDLLVELCAERLQVRKYIICK